jgi:two-component system cell cycle response regulator
MSADEGKPAARGQGPLRTKPLAEAGSLREALHAELLKTLHPSLLVVGGPDIGKRARLERSTEVGRDPDTLLPLADESVSWHHFRLEDRGAGEWALVDLGSTNGTIVNGTKMVEATLKPGDRIFVGNTIVEFQRQDAIQEGYAAELERLLSVDELSGLWVKRRFDAELVKAVVAMQAGSKDVGPVVTVIVMDLDGVKPINDTHGHHMGAFVIGEAGHVIGATLGARGFATRFGGDEFAAALPGVSKDEAVTIAESLRVAVSEHVYEKAGVRVYPGMSCGVASVPGDAEDAVSVFRAADQAMYRAKRAGKSRVST